MGKSLCLARMQQEQLWGSLILDAYGKYLWKRKSLPQPLELLVSLWHRRKRTRGENSFSLYSWLYFIPALPLGDGSRMSPLACALFGVS